MSVRVATRVWNNSAHSGTELLMLLAIADFADDDGHAYPAVGTLAKKCRMSPRNANFILAALRDSGELEIRFNEGPKGTNRYRIVEGVKSATAQPLKQASPSTLKPFSPPPPEATFTPEADFTLKHTSATPEAGFLKPLKPTSDESSLNRQEPSSRPKLPLCPHSEIVGLFHEVLPELPRIKMMGKKRQADLSSFWKWVFTEKRTDGTARAATSAEAMSWIRTYFDRTRGNDFLMGRTARSDVHSNWRCSLDFLLTERGRIQVIEKTEVVA